MPSTRASKRGVLIGVAWTALALGLAVSGQLIRPQRVYRNVVREIHDYFNSTCIILMHATPNPIETQEFNDGDSLLALQKYFSSTLHIRTAIMDIQMFKDRIGLKYYNIKRPLFVLLNDRDDVRSEFANVSTWIRMSYPTWLVFFDTATRPGDFFRNIYVPFDCTFIVSRPKGGSELLTEVYQIDKDQELRTTRFGAWSDTRGFRGPTLSLWERRNDLYGHLLRVTMIDDPPMSYIHYDKDGKVTSLGGALGDFLKLLQQNMNCTLVYQEADGWAGITNALKNHEADIAGNELMVTEERMKMFDFTTPLLTTKCRPYIKTPTSTAVKWKAYFAPFDSSIWHFLGLLIVVTSTTISAIRAAMRIALSYMQDYRNTPSRFTEVIFTVFGAFCNQGIPHSLLDPVRLAHLVIHLTAVVVLAAYSAALISYLAVKSFAMPFTTMEGLLKDGSYSFGLVANSADYTFFQSSTDATLQTLFNDLILKEVILPENYIEGLRRICNHEKYAFVTTESTATVLQNSLDCTLEALDTVKQTSIAMAVRPGSPYRGIINNNILLVRDSGVLQRLLRSAVGAGTIRPPPPWTAVEFNDVVPLLVVMQVGLMLSIVMLCLERLIYRKHQHKRMSRKRAKKRKVTIQKARIVY